MAYEQNILESVAQFDTARDVSLKQTWKPISVATIPSENLNAGFDCNICLDSAHDPVVTLCGHLYCWPCIYKWLHVQSSSFESDEEPKCPVCKANISQSSLVPLYGRGTFPSESDAKMPQLDLVTPRRPTAQRLHALVNAATSMTSDPSQQLHSYPFQSLPQPFPNHHNFPHPYSNYTSGASSNFGGTAMTSFFNPTVGMFGEMVFGSSDSDASSYPYPHSNTYPLAVNGSLRMRRQEMQVDKSLNRVSVFLFCCFILCLLLF